MTDRGKCHRRHRGRKRVECTASSRGSQSTADRRHQLGASKPNATWASRSSARQLPFKRFPQRAQPIAGPSSGRCRSAAVRKAARAATERVAAVGCCRTASHRPGATARHVVRCLPAASKAERAQQALGYARRLRSAWWLASRRAVCKCLQRLAPAMREACRLQPQAPGCGARYAGRQFRRAGSSPVAASRSSSAQAIGGEQARCFVGADRAGRVELVASRLRSCFCRCRVLILQPVQAASAASRWADATAELRRSLRSSAVRPAAAAAGAFCAQRLLGAGCSGRRSSSACASRSRRLARRVRAAQCDATRRRAVAARLTSELQRLHRKAITSQARAA